MSDLLQQRGDGYVQVLSLRKHVRQSAIYERRYFTLDTAILLCRISLYKRRTFLSFGSRGPQWGAAAKQQGLFQDDELLKKTAMKVNYISQDNVLNLRTDKLP